MAHGVQKRMPGIKTPKQFCPVCGTPIIKRTLRQIGKRANVTIVCPHIEPWLSLERVRLLPLDKPGDCLLDGLRELVISPGSHILLGDVIFSDDALDGILSADSMQFFARSGASKITNKKYGEVFALACTDPTQLGVWLSEPGLQPGGFWTLINHLKLPVTEIDDYTDDIDSIRDIDLVLPHIEAAIQKELT